MSKEFSLSIELRNLPNNGGRDLLGKELKKKDKKLNRSKYKVHGLSKSEIPLIEGKLCL